MATYSDDDFIMVEAQSEKPEESTSNKNNPSLNSPVEIAEENIEMVGTSNKECDKNNETSTESLTDNNQNIKGTDGIIEKVTMTNSERWGFFESAANEWRKKFEQSAKEFAEKMELDIQNTKKLLHDENKMDTSSRGIDEKEVAKFVRSVAEKITSNAVKILKDNQAKMMLLRRENDALKEKNRKLEETQNKALEDLKKEKIAHKTTVMKTSEEIHSLKTNINKRTANFSENLDIRPPKASKSTKEFIDGAKQELEKLKKRFEDEKQEFEKKRDEIEEAESEAQDLYDEIREIRSEGKELKDEMNDLKEEMEMDSSNNKWADFQQKLETTTTSLNDLLEQLKQKKKEIKSQHDSIY